jgi:hypothetical protein
MLTTDTIINYIKLGVAKSSLLQTKYDQYTYLKNHLLMTKYIMDIPYIRRVKSTEKYVAGRYIKSDGDRQKKPRSLSIKLYTSI